jgi:hypothetical protein
MLNDGIVLYKQPAKIKIMELHIDTPQKERLKEIFKRLEKHPAVSSDEQAVKVIQDSFYETEQHVTGVGQMKLQPLHEMKTAVFNGCLVCFSLHPDIGQHNAKPRHVLILWQNGAYEIRKIIRSRFFTVTDSLICNQPWVLNLFWLVLRKEGK